MIEITENVYYVGVNDFTTDLFESMWLLPHGVSYNSYLVKGSEKIALIDTSKIMFLDEYFNNIERVVPIEKIDYIVMNHMEPDHSGVIKHLRARAPNSTIVLTKRAAPMLESLYGITDNIKIVDEGDSINLGDRELVFYMDPFVHWPETMVTYDTKAHILFSCDAFGSFKALDGANFDDQVDVEEWKDETIRYFSNIVGKYTKYVGRALDKLASLQIDVIAPSHGLIWRKDPKKVIELYRNLAEMRGEPGVVVIWGSMYGNTKVVVDHVVEGIKTEGLPVTVLDVARDNISYQLMHSWKNKGIILGFPTYDGAEFPPMSYYLMMVKRKGLRNRIVGFFGSSLWSGRALKQAADKLSELDWEIVEPLLEFRGHPSDELLKQAKELGKTVAQKVKESFK